MSLVAANVETDLLGTFSGEVERWGSVREVLRAKIELAIKTHPASRLFLASEGSFGPHPHLGFVPSDMEALMLFDKKENTEFYVEWISTEVVHDQIEISLAEKFDDFLSRNKFPSHGVLIRPAGLFKPIYKGIHDRHTVIKAIHECAKTSPDGKVLMAMDLRCQHSPTRQKVIFQAGEKLIESLKSHCPECDYPGFIIVGAVAGLPCCQCGKPSAVAKEVLFECVLCKHKKTSLRPDGLLFLPAQECQFCNP